MNNTDTTHHLDGLILHEHGGIRYTSTARGRRYAAAIGLDLQRLAVIDRKLHAFKGDAVHPVPLEGLLAVVESAPFVKRAEVAAEPPGPAMPPEDTEAPLKARHAPPTAPELHLGFVPPGGARRVLPPGHTGRPFGRAAHHCQASRLAWVPIADSPRYALIGLADLYKLRELGLSTTVFHMRLAHRVGRQPRQVLAIQTQVYKGCNRIDVARAILDARPSQIVETLSDVADLRRTNLKLALA